jgi:hypothetical protein
MDPAHAGKVDCGNFKLWKGLFPVELSFNRVKVRYLPAVIDDVLL